MNTKTYRFFVSTKSSSLDGLVVNDFLTQLNDFYKRLELWYDSKTPILVKIYENYRKQVEGMIELKTRLLSIFQLQNIVELIETKMSFNNNIN
jgi:hypothetical protein